MPEKANHVMIDIETLGTAPGSAIVSIGAVFFNPGSDPSSVEGGGATYYANIEKESSYNFGLTTDKDTIAWWNKQTPDSIALLQEAQRPVDEVLADFAQWFRNSAGKYPWSHGASFDLVLLEAAFKAIDKRPPWTFYNQRDTRTLFHWARIKVDRTEGTKHYALDDAKRQAEAVCRAWPKS